MLAAGAGGAGFFDLKNATPLVRVVQHVKCKQVALSCWPSTSPLGGYSQAGEKCLHCI